MNSLRSLKRNVAKERMKLMGFKKVNRHIGAQWRDIGAPDYVKKMEQKYKTHKQTAKTKEEA